MSSSRTPSGQQRGMASEKSMESVTVVGSDEEDIKEVLALPVYQLTEDGAAPTANQWNSEEWTDNILKRDFVQSSEQKLDARLNEFLGHASKKELQSYENSRRNLIYIIESAQQKYTKRFREPEPGSEKRFVELFKAGCREASEVAFEFSKILDVMVQQAPMYVSLAYGAVKLLLYAEINSQELKSNVKTYMERIKATFDMVDHLTVYMPSANLVNAITQMYELFNRFLAKSLKLYTQNRAKMYVAAFARPWRKLDGIVSSIEFIYAKVKDIAQFHSNIMTSANLSINRENLATSRNLVALGEGTLAVIQQLSQQVEALSVKIAKESDVREVASLLQQRVEEKLDNPRLEDSNRSEAGQSVTKPIENHNGRDFDRLLQDVFVELRDFDTENNQRREVLEQLPEMREHRSKKRNMLRAENIMQWIESENSQLLWIDGNDVLRRSDFNSLFAVPLVILGENTFESILVLRHFCGDGLAVKTNNYRTLVQALIFQIFKQRPNIFKDKAAQLNRDRTSNLLKLWDLFLECLHDAHADCTFIIINSIDHLQDGEVRNGVSEREIVLRQLESLVGGEHNLIKILLTASIARNDSSDADGQIALAIPFQSKNSSQRELSLSTVRNELGILPQRLVDFQERTGQSVSFGHLPMLYPLNSVIYRTDGDQLRAYIVAELSGMEHRSLNTYAPLRIRAWSVDHNGSYFTKHYDEFLISQFPGEKAISSLKFVPAGYLPDEAEKRKQLIARGRIYWELGSNIYYKQFIKRREPVRIMIDLQSRPVGERPIQEFEDQFQVTEDSHALKPSLLLACPPTIPAYSLRDRTWIDVETEDITDILFQYDILDQLILYAEENKSIILNLVKSCLDTSGQTKRAPLLDRDQNFTGHSGEVVVLLLHGESGSGKTFTVNCIAETVRRPIVTIVPETDQGFAQLEKSLAHSFNLAKRWGAIILIEDSDMLLGQGQDKTGVTLRAIDHYSGVIFMTTIRVSDFDKAVLSRISQQFPFGILGQADKTILWTNLLQGAKLEYPDLDLKGLIDFVESDSFSYATRTGRDIQNSFKAAKRLATQQKRTLDKEHLEAVLAPRQSFARHF